MTTATRKGMRLQVYRPAPARNSLFNNDSTNGGISSTATSVTVTGIQRTWGPDSDPEPVPVPKVMQVFEPTADAPEVTLIIRSNGHVNWLHLEPATAPPANQTPWMSGGNYAGTSDSRWSKLVGQHGEMVRIHDRSDTWQDYDSLTR